MRIPRKVAVVALVPLLLLAADARAAELTFTSPDALSFTLPSDDYQTVSLRSDAAAANDVTWQLVVAKKDADPIVVGEQATPDQPAKLEIKNFPADQPGIAANAVKSYRVRVTGLGADDIAGAQLVAQVPSAAPATLKVSLAKKATLNPTLDQVLLGSLVAAIVLMLLRRIGLKGKEVGTVDLDFSKSFATTLTAVGALLGTILSAGVLDKDAAPISSAGFQSLNIAFGVLVLVAPLVFLAFQKPKSVSVVVDGKQQNVVHFTGPTWALLVSSMVTLWAVLGEIWTIYLLLGEIDVGADFGPAAMTAIQVALGAAAVLSGWYSWKKLSWIVDTPDGGTAPSLGGGFLPVSLAVQAPQSWTPL